MELNNSFMVQRSVDEAWAVLTDLERIAPCMPGAQLTEIEGNEYRGLVKVKVGPIVATYRGTATLTSLDEVEHVATIEASGRDPRLGRANALITAALTPDDDGTKVELATDLSLTGKLASIGQGAITDVSANILEQFAANLEAMLAAEATVAAPPAAAEAATGTRPVEGPEPEPVDLAAIAAAPVLRRVLPVLAAVGLVLVVLWLRRRLR